MFVVLYDTLSDAVLRGFFVSVARPGIEAVGLVICLDEAMSPQKVQREYTPMKKEAQR